MSRVTKKIVYGAFWIALCALIVAFLYVRFLKPAPSCSDGRMNQGETGIDCGGPCASCEARSIIPLRVIRPAEFFTMKSGGRAILAQVLNPNTTYAASSFSYEFRVFDEKGDLRETIPGEEALFPSETRYLIAQTIVTVPQHSARVELVVWEPRWKPRQELVRPDLSVAPGAVTEVIGESVFVRGTVRGQNTIPARRVQVLAILLDRSGNELFPSQGMVTDLAGMSELPFVIQFPADSSIALRVDTAATRLFVTGQ